MAEHSMTTVWQIRIAMCVQYANFFERMLFAPLYVNYHAEHHLFMGAPAYKYPKLHQMLLEKSFYGKRILSMGLAPCKTGRLRGGRIKLRVIKTNTPMYQYFNPLQFKSTL